MLAIRHAVNDTGFGNLGVCIAAVMLPSRISDRRSRKVLSMKSIADSPEIKCFRLTLVLTKWSERERDALDCASSKKKD
jgi:hypothetical protein